MPGFNLERNARRFASEIQDVLNGTVCHGITISAVGTAGTGVFKIGYGLRSDDFRAHAIPLTIGAKAPSGYLRVSYSLLADDAGRYLMVESSALAYGHDEDLDHPLLHYDYERDKVLEQGYSDSHLQVCAHSDAWTTIRERRGLNKEFSALHLPLGGKRFRPTLENLIGFLIAEGLADYRDPEACRQVLRAGQERYDDLQLAAAVRRNPETARRVLREIDQQAAASVPDEPSGKGRGKGRHRR